ncbi:hypothetical protein [Streptomyces sp. NPDC001815]|uniref:hypothetical protein n=1 Tax=Streptomyces sp. NPDC001815 TaxID=3154526 RepID=UPI003328CC5A
MNAASPAGPATLRQPTSWCALVDRAGRRYPGDRPRWCGDDSSPLTVAQRPGIPSRWRYADALGIPGLKPVALGEGRTPLLSRRLVGLDVAVKMETQLR